MKCKQCGANSKLENNFCPYCGAENTEYKLHRRQMFHLKRDYEETKEQIIKENKIIANSSVKITVIAALIALNLVVWALETNSWSIMRSFKALEERKDIEVHREKLLGYEKENNYSMLAAYYDEHILYEVEDLEEFRRVYQACANYAYAYGFIVDLKNPESYLSKEESIRILCDNLDYMYDFMDENQYGDSRYYEGQHKITMDNLKEDVALLLITYGGITREEAERFHKMSDGQRQIALERGVGLYED